MKLTWFGGGTMRVHIGGRILVVGTAEAPGVDADELLSGADRHIPAVEMLEAVDPLIWHPRRALAAIDETGREEVVAHRIGIGTALIEAMGEPPLVLSGADKLAAGRWVKNAVVVAFSAEAALAALEAEPRLLALAMPERAVEAVFPELERRGAGVGLVALEPGMALEV